MSVAHHNLPELPLLQAAFEDWRSASDPASRVTAVERLITAGDAALAAIHRRDPDDPDRAVLVALVDMVIVAVRATSDGRA